MKNQIELAHIFKTFIQWLHENLYEIQDTKIRLLLIYSKYKIQCRIMSINDFRCVTPFRYAPLQIITKRIRTLCNLLEDSTYDALLFVFASLWDEVKRMLCIDSFSIEWEETYHTLVELYKSRFAKIIYDQNPFYHCVAGDGILWGVVFTNSIRQIGDSTTILRNLVKESRKVNKKSIFLALIYEAREGFCKKTRDNMWTHRENDDNVNIATNRWWIQSEVRLANPPWDCRWRCSSGNAHYSWSGGN